MIHISPAAEAELRWEVSHLEAERPGWGERLLAEVEDACSRLERHPGLAQPIPGYGSEVRRYVLRRFRLALVFVTLDDEQTIIAVAPSRRDPEYWKERLE